MPIYEYRCQRGHVSELMQSFSDEPLSACEVCGAPVQKVFHPVSVHFKGSGFYNTDYGTRRRAREGKDGKESSGSGADGGGTDGGGTDGAGKSDQAGKSDAATGAKSGSAGSGQGKAAA